jgi:hypothetical protein
MNTLIKQEAEKVKLLKRSLMALRLELPQEVADAHEKITWDAMEEYAQSLQRPGWVKASELPLESDLPDFVVTLIDGRVFAYDTWHNIKGLREVVKHHPEMLCLCLNKPKSPTL